jgi:hypothetical protein
MPSVEDFPDPHDPKAAVFIQWVRLCEIIGRVGKAIAKGKIHEPDSIAATDLLNWTQTLPDHLQLPISDDRTAKFNRDIHMLHLPYLATTILLHLQKTTEKLPRASISAIVAASCVARALQDILVRGTLRFLSGQSGWYISISIIALLYARKIEVLSTHANADIAILLAALKEMAVLWHSSKMFYSGFERIIEADSLDFERATLANDAKYPLTNDQTHTSPNLIDIPVINDPSWRERFPYVTMKTTPLIAALLVETIRIPFTITEIESSQVNYLFDLFDDLNPDLFQMDLSL